LTAYQRHFLGGILQNLDIFRGLSHTHIHDAGCDVSSTNISLNSTNENVSNNDDCWAFQSLSFTLDAVSKNMSLTAGNTFTATTSSLLTVTTNSAFGYQVKAYETSLLTYGSETIANWAGTNATPTTWPGTCIDDTECGFGYNTNDADLSQFTDSTYYAGFITTAPGDVVASDTGPVTSDQTTITYKTSVGNTQAAGTYETTIIYIAIPEF